jgi:hypothetical protein
MTFGEAITANQQGPVVSPSGEFFPQDSFSRRALSPDSLFSVQDFYGKWTSGGVSFAAAVAAHGTGGILLHPETGDNFFNALSPFIGSLGKVIFTKETT